MAQDIEINQLPLISNLQGSDVLPVSRGDSFTKKARVNDVAIITPEYPYEAGEQITSLMAVAVVNNKAYKFDPTNEAHYYKCIGIATQSVIAGETVNVIKEGKYQNSGFILTQDSEYYVAANAMITNIQPTSGIFQPIGIALETDTLLIKIEDPTILT